MPVIYIATDSIVVHEQCMGTMLAFNYHVHVVFLVVLLLLAELYVCLFVAASWLLLLLLLNIP